MSFIVSFLKGVINAVKGIFTFVGMIFSIILSWFKSLPLMLENFPQIISGVMITFVAISIVYLILGRGK